MWLLIYARRRVPRDAWIASATRWPVCCGNSLANQPSRRRSNDAKSWFEPQACAPSVCASISSGDLINPPLNNRRWLRVTVWVFLIHLPASTERWATLKRAAQNPRLCGRPCVHSPLVDDPRPTNLGLCVGNVTSLCGIVCSDEHAPILTTRRVVLLRASRDDLINGERHETNS